MPCVCLARESDLEFEELVNGRVYTTLQNPENGDDDGDDDDDEGTWQHHWLKQHEVSCMGMKGSSLVHLSYT
jgi:hypothetical protein